MVLYIALPAHIAVASLGMCCSRIPCTVELATVVLSMLIGYGFQN